jgi:hypothetical protein
MGSFPENGLFPRTFRNPCNRFFLSPRRQFQLALVMLLALPGFAQKATAPGKISTTAQEKGDRLLNGLPLLFEQNQGQREEGISFITNANGYRLTLATGGATFSLQNKKEAPAELHMSLKGANPKAEAVGLNKVQAKINYLLGKDSSKWITNVPNFEQVAVRDALPGVDVLYYGNDRQLEYDFSLAAGVDPNSVVLNFDGSSGLKLDTAGDLVIATSAGEVKLKRPVAYQNAFDPGSSKTPVQVSYLLKDGGDIGFRVEAYDRTRPLVIDPVLQYATFFSGIYTSPDYAQDTVVIMGMATDNSGNSYIYGYDPGTRLGAGANTAGSCPAGGCVNVFIMKFNPSLSGAASLVYTTLIPAIAAEDLQANALGSAYGPYATYGSVVGDDGNNAFFPSFALSLDSSGNIYITGSADNPDYPTTTTGYEPSCNMNPNDPLLEYCVPAAYISKISPDGTSMLYSTFMNAGAPLPAPMGYPQFGITTFPSIGFGIVADNSQKVYVAVDTAAGFPVTNGLPCSYTEPFGNVPECNSAAIVKLDTTLSGSAGLIYSEEFEQFGDTTSGFGGPAFFLATDGVGDAYATGGGCYPLESGIGLTPIPLNGYDTAMPAPAAPCSLTIKLDTSGNVAYATYFSPFSTFDDQTLQIGGIAADPDGHVYLEGVIEPATDLPIVGNGYLFTVPDAATTLYAGQFVTGFDTTLTGTASLVYSSALEGVQPQTRTQIASNSCGSLAITGDLDSAAFPFVYPVPGAIESSNLSLVFPPFAAVLNTRLPGQAGLIFSSSLYTNPDFQVSMSNLSLNQQGNLSMDGFLLADTITSDYPTFPTANAYQSAPSVPAGAGPAPFFQVIQGAVTPGCINIAPLTLAFGSEPVGSTTATQPITLTNTLGSTLTISSIVPSAGFTESDNCGTALSTNASCTVNAAFNPTAAGAQTGTLTFTDGDVGSPQVVTLTGTGMATVTPEPLAVLAAASAFGSLTEGTSSEPQGILLSNGGNATLNISGIAITGPGAPSFVESDDCGTTLAAGSNCTINVTFAPDAVGSLSATLSVADDASNTPQTDTLTGTGVAPQLAQLQFTPTVLSAIAGTGTCGQTTELDPALQATLCSAGSVAQDAAGNTYILNTQENYVSKIDTSGNITAFAGIRNTGPGSFSGDGGPATAANLSSPTDVAVDPLGNVYIADYGNGRIREVNPTTGIITTFAGDGVLDFFNGGPAKSISLAPVGITFDPSGNLFIAETNQQIIVKIDTLGNASVFAGVLTDQGPGVVGYNGDNILAINADLAFPNNVASDQAGNIYIADTSNNRVRMVNASTGIITTIAGTGAPGENGDGGPATAAAVNPAGVSTDLAGDVFISVNDDSGGPFLHLVRKVDTSGNITTYAGGSGAGALGGPATSVTLADAFFARVDLNGDLLIPTLTQVLSAGPQGILNFGNQPVNTTSAPMTLILENTGNVPVTFAGEAEAVSTALKAHPDGVSTGNPVTVTGDFAIATGGTCDFTAPLAPGATCTVNVTFTPTTGGALTGTISVTSNSVNTPNGVQLLGLGTVTTAPQAVLSPTNLTFPSTTVGATASAQSITLSNPGNAILNIADITITGTSPADFAETTTCGGQLAAGANCSISVTFTPASAASFSAIVSVDDEAANTPQTATLSGTGTAPPIPQAVLSPTSLTFPSTTDGSTATAQLITVSNPGNSPLSITGISITGANPSDFADTTTCGSTLASGANCTISVTFTPATAATFSATVSVADNAAGSPQTAAISGTGVVPPPAPDFGVTSSTPTQTIQPGASAQYTIAVASASSESPFNGAVTLTVSGLPSGATASFNPASVTPGSSGATSTLTVQTGTVASGTPDSSSPPGTRTAHWYLTTASLAFLCMGFLRRRKRWPPRMAILFAVAFGGLCAAGLSGCGGGFALPAKTSTTATSPVTYMITVTGTSGTDQHSTSVSLTVE